MTTLIGTNPDQVPVNSMLGGMAYQDPESVSVKDLRYSGMLTGIGSSSISSSAGDISSTVHADNATGAAILILKAGNGSTSSYYSYIRIINNGSSPKTWDIGTRGNDSLHIFDGTTSRMVVSSSVDYVQFNSGNTSFFIGNGATAGGGTTDDTSFNWSLAGAVKLCRNSTLVAEIDTANNLVIKTTGALKISEGTTAQRPASPQEGMIRKNSTLGVIEGYSGGGYVSLEAGRLIARTVYSTPGSYTWTPNSKTKHVIAILVSAGGGSGGCPPTNATQGAVSAPGKNGQYMRCEIPRDSTLGTNYAVVVGAGGSYGFGGVSPTSGGSGGDSSITNNTSGAVISVIGGGYGDPGYTSTTFPFVRSSDGAYLSTNTGGHFVIWERSFSVPIYCVLFGLNGDIMLSQPSVHSIGVSSGFKGRGARSCLIGNNSASGSAGFSGDNGEVIIYEYS